MPIMVGGNGPNVTWRLAARFADELNLDGLSPDELRAALPRSGIAARRSAAIPTRWLRVHVWWGPMPGSTAEIGAVHCCELAELGVSRVMGLLQAARTDDRRWWRWPRTPVPPGSISTADAHEADEGMRRVAAGICVAALVASACAPTGDGADGSAFEGDGSEPAYRKAGRRSPSDPHDWRDGQTMP